MTIYASLHEGGVAVGDERSRTEFYNMNTPLLSVIIPIYNTAPYLDQCLTSVATQTYTNIEVIMVNDGSTDTSPEIAKSFADRDDRFTLMNQSNQGNIKARETGLHHIHGGYFTFVDSDDWIENDDLQKLMTPIIEDNAEIVMGSFVKDNNLPIDISFPWGIVDKVTALRELIDARLFNFATWNKIYHKRFASLYFSWWTPCSLQEDLEFNWKALLNSGKISIIPVYGYHYVTNKNSITENKTTAHDIELSVRYEHIIKDIKQNSLLRSLLPYAIRQSIQQSYYYLPDKITPDDKQKYYPRIKFILDEFNSTPMKSILLDWLEYKYRMYLYGAGKMGLGVNKFFYLDGIKTDGFVTSSSPMNKAKHEHNVDYIIKNISNSKFIITMNSFSSKEVEACLIRKGIRDYISFNDINYWSYPNL